MHAVIATTRVASVYYIIHIIIMNEKHYPHQTVITELRSVDGADIRLLLKFA